MNACGFNFDSPLPCDGCNRSVVGKTLVCACAGKIAAALIADLGNGAADIFPVSEPQHKAQRVSRFLPMAVRKDGHGDISAALAELGSSPFQYHLAIQNRTPDEGIDTTNWALTGALSHESLTELIQAELDELAPQGIWEPVTLLKWSETVTEVIEGNVDTPDETVVNLPAGQRFTVTHGLRCSVCCGIHKAAPLEFCLFCNASMHPADGAAASLAPDWESLLHQTEE